LVAELKQGIPPEFAVPETVTGNGNETVPENVGEASGAQPVQAAKIPAAVSKIPLSVSVHVVLLVTQEIR
jgi:hypothetical protein